MLVCLVFVVGACQKADSAQRSAELTAKAATTPTPTKALALAPAIAMAAPAKASCGCSGGAESCGGSCGPSCGGGSTPMPQWAAVPDKSGWTSLRVTGMHCGGCAKRIERALANVDGVLAVRTDFRTARVDVAAKPGIDARNLVKPTIDGLGYHVE